MGKTTVGRFLEQASLKVQLSSEEQKFKIIFKRISYDVVFTDL